jgi:antitoxin HigA-1
MTTDPQPARMNHPGVLLARELAARGLTPKDIAQYPGLPVYDVEEIIEGGMDIDADVALILERVFGSSAEMWLGLQMAYDLHEARKGQAR